MTARWLCAHERALPTGDAWLTVRERELAEQLRFPKRRIDYLLGRYVAKRAVALALGLPSQPDALRRLDVRNRRSGPERGAPEVVVDGRGAPVEISITDRAGWGVCLVRAAGDPPGARLGCDLELVEPRSRAFVADYLTRREAALVHAAADDESRQVLANLVWCAKESALKVLRTGLRRDTRSVEVRLAEGDATASWQRLTIWDREALREIPGWWRRFGHFLLTVAADAELAPPEAFAAEPDLATAVPSHDWMASPAPRAPGAEPRSSG
jgi:4'-phosphopantetheinyl transferase